jgi:hypothetical protein
MVLKGAPNGCIAKQEFCTYHRGGQYACQTKAWMDKTLVPAWIDDILKPYKDKKDARDPGGPPPILILDAYRVHQMGSVVNCIQEVGIEVLHIPAGCTYLCQPIDVEINKPLKDAMREKWEPWMTTGGIVNGIAKEPTHQQVENWLVDAYTNIPTNVCRNAWKKSKYVWF